MPYAQGVYTSFDMLPAPERSELSSSRKIDFPTGDYVLDDLGGFKAMDDTDQRVVLLVAFAVKPEKFITPQTINSRKDAIRKALDVLTSSRNPVIKNVDVTVKEISPGRLSTEVSFHNVKTGTKSTVQT